MLAIPTAFLDKNVYAYRQICKRAKNTLDAIVAKRYVISEKKWFRTVYYEVNVFGECRYSKVSPDKILEWMLQNDHVSAQDYQLLKFYDISNMVDIVIEDLEKRCGDSDLVSVSIDEMQFLYYIGTFTEDSNLTKEELLFGEQV